MREVPLYHLSYSHDGSYNPDRILTSLGVAPGWTAETLQTPTCEELISTLGALFPRGGPVQDPVLIPHAMLQNFSLQRAPRSQEPPTRRTLQWPYA